MTVRHFLITPTSTADEIIFIDALDEKRAGRRDRDTVDALVQKLFDSKPKKVRLACRAHDWLGGTDLASLRPFFDLHGGVRVLTLMPLTESEQHALLNDRGVVDAEKFVEEAKKRGLADFLQNPQNLIMLSEAVKDKKWPANTRELLDSATKLLLREHNTDRARTGIGVFNEHEVRPPAGASDALRLISDVDGICLAETSDSPHRPSYRTIPFAPGDLVLAALSRRAFRSIGDECVDYLHRILAEYLAAEWLADRVRNHGFPITRVIALTSVDGIPTPELRGMHAWLTILLPEHATLLIRADPFGKLIYGDPTQLGLTLRRDLLSALRTLATADPHFRPEIHSNSNLAILSQPDMATELRTILQERDGPFGLKAIVLEALAQSPVPALKSNLLNLVVAPEAPFGLKRPAILSLLRQDANAELLKCYKRLDNEPDNLRVRAEILSHLYASNFSESDLVAFISDVSSSKGQMVGGTLWSVARSIPEDRVVPALDALRSTLHTESSKKFGRREVPQFIDDLVVRVLSAPTEGITGARLYGWIDFRLSLRDDHSLQPLENIRNALKQSARLIRETFIAALSAYRATQPFWSLLRRLRAWLPVPLHDEPLQWLSDRITSGAYRGAKLAQLYEMALNLCFENPDASESTFEALYALADGLPQLLPVRAATLTAEIHPWRQREAERLAVEAKKQSQGRERNVAEFQKNALSIEHGLNINWLTWIANIYFANYSDVDSSLSPRQRLEAALGPDSVGSALQGLKAFVRRSRNVPSLTAILDAARRNEFPMSWYIALAGMDECWLERPSLKGFAERTLKSLLALDLVIPTTTISKDNVMRTDDREWKHALIKADKALVISVYTALARNTLDLPNQPLNGFFELLRGPFFEAERDQIALRLLERFPEAQPQRLEDMLLTARTKRNEKSLRNLARKFSSPEAGLNPEQRRLWVITGYLTDAESFRSLLREETRSPEIVWQLRALTKHTRDQAGTSLVMITPEQLGELTSLIGRHCENVGFPNGGWSGDRNPWDGAEYVRNMLATLSALTDDQSQRTLRGLLFDPNLVGFTNDVKHFIANQQAKVREMAFQQPTWDQAIAALSNDKPASVADLSALVVEYLKAISLQINAGNTDLYKQLFWNEDTFGRPTTARVEESARDAIVDQLRVQSAALGLVIEPEGHMATDKRADIVIFFGKHKLVLELKRDSHPELWRAYETQLERFYTRDPQASGYGIYLVLWYGANRSGTLPSRGKGLSAPKSASELQSILQELVGRNPKLVAVVVDVSIPDGGKPALSPKGATESGRPAKSKVSQKSARKRVTTSSLAATKRKSSGTKRK